MQQHLSHLMHRHEHRLPVDTKKNDRDKPPPPPPAKERPAEGPLGANSAKAKRVKLHRAPSSFKALTDVLVAGRRLQHRSFAALEFKWVHKGIWNWMLTRGLAQPEPHAGSAAQQAIALEGAGVSEFAFVRLPGNHQVRAHVLIARGKRMEISSV